MLRLKAGSQVISAAEFVNIQRLDFTWDDVGNMTSVKDGRNWQQYQCYSYDTHHRLTGAYTDDTAACNGQTDKGSGNYDHTYGCDDLGNLTGNAGVTQTFGTDGPHLIATAGSDTFDYDANGNRVELVDGSDTWGYAWDAENRLNTVTHPSGATVDYTKYRYDADGNRVHKWTETGNDETLYVAGLFEVDCDGSNTIQEIRMFVNAGGSQLAVRVWDTSSWETSFVFSDYVGTATSTFNIDTDTRRARGYYPYGEERWDNGAFPSDHGYTGQISDGDRTGTGTGLNYYVARYHDPLTGSFISPDTIIPDAASSIGLNRTAYVNDNPIRYDDPSGHCIPGVDCPDPGTAGGVCRR